ncbi:hypothetical protein QJS10_CPA05g01454 [Acorus calamus]|uniref:Reverse transcriptase zinc-binding domain-containing protein n=1 Tax=Acorus calamus TaxID=4465 RepID=A0AAV9ERW6_ACOCL|nr:hypothetical protein QJS10_CPA05g01454 [Acorus calamus]
MKMSQIGEGYNLISLECASATLPSCSWSKILWHPIQTPKHSLLRWQAMLNKLPSRDRLLAQGMAMPNLCGLCNLERELAGHLFIQCSYSSYVWSALFKCLGLRRQQHSSIEDHLGWFVKLAKTDSERKVMYAILSQTIWSLWIKRNARVFQHKATSKFHIVKHILQATKSKLRGCLFDDVDSPLTGRLVEVFGVCYKESQKLSIPVIWIPPPNGWFKANSDGSLSDDRYGFGALLQTHSGECIQALSACVRACSINILELKGVVAGVTLAQSSKASHVWSETDSTTVVAWSQGRGIIPRSAQGGCCGRYFGSKF